VDALALPASDRFRLMPDGYDVDLELIAGGERHGIQVPVAVGAAHSYRMYRPATRPSCTT